MINGLMGGKVLKVNPDRLKLHPNADEPRLRLGSPGTLITNAGSHEQICQCSEKELGIPVPSHVIILLYQVDPDIYVVVRPTKESKGEDVYALRTGRHRPVIRGLKDLFESHQIPIATDLWYDMETQVVPVEGLGLCVVGNWTKAQTSPRVRGERDDVEATEAELEELEALEDAESGAAASEQME